MQILIRLCVLIALCLSPFWLLAQAQSDTVKSNSLTRKAFKLGAGYITTNKRDTVRNESSVDVNKVYEGKIIRQIYLQHIDFERSIYDSTKRTKKIISDLAHAFHGTTKEGIVRQHLFIKENTPLNPGLLSDNERYIRDLDFILDCRIVVVPLPDQPDSVDVSVMTKDVFSLGVRIGGSIPTAPLIGIYDANLAGLGQRLEFDVLMDGSQSPSLTSAAYYRKSSAFGSLVNLELGYTQLNTAISKGDEWEYAYYFRATRPLVSPYSRLAGALEFSNNWSHNIDREPDSTFLQYTYKVSDVWVGYNFGVKRKAGDRKRVFLAARFSDGAYLDRPEQAEYDDVAQYNSAHGYLAELTFYRQDFYRTRYVFGFGRTEDVPYGLSLSFSTGYIKQLGTERPYSAAKFRWSVANRKGNFYIFNIQAGTFVRSGHLEDGVVTGRVSYFTRALNVGNNKLRGLITGGYATLLGQDLLPSIKINVDELPSFSADSIWGNHKAFFRVEPTLYTSWQLLGFRFAPFIGGIVLWLDCETCPGGNTNFYELSAGVRTRNESLIFGTIELRLSYIPATDVTSSQFSFGFKQRLTVKNTGSYVRPPSLVQY
ncbi:MAG TPA: hypothetical protein VIU12_18085 [Chryseolinea sp.]